MCPTCPIDNDGKTSNQIQIVVQQIAIAQGHHDDALEFIKQAIIELKRANCIEALAAAMDKLQKAQDAQLKAKEDLASLYILLNKLGSILNDYEKQVAQLQGALATATADSRACQVALLKVTTESSTALAQCHAKGDKWCAYFI